MEFNFHRYSCMRSNIHTNYVHKLTLHEVMFRVKIKKSMESMRIETVFNSFIHIMLYRYVWMSFYRQLLCMVFAHTHTHTFPLYLHNVPFTFSLLLCLLTLLRLMFVSLVLSLTCMYVVRVYCVLIGIIGILSLAA